MNPYHQLRDYLAAHPEQTFKARQLASIFGMSSSQATKYLHNLVERKLVKRIPRKPGRGDLYST